MGQTKQLFEQLGEELENRLNEMQQEIGQAFHRTQRTAEEWTKLAEARRRTALLETAAEKLLKIFYDWDDEDLEKRSISTLRAAFLAFSNETGLDAQEEPTIMS